MNHEIIKSSDKITELESELEEKNRLIIQLNKKLDEIADKMESAGCSFKHPLSDKLEIKNIKAEELQKKLDNILDVLENPTSISYKDTVSNAIEFIND